eukprot:3031626-Amphidinium_carterae.1
MQHTPCKSAFKNFASKANSKSAPIYPKETLRSKRMETNQRFDFLIVGFDFGAPMPCVGFSVDPNGLKLCLELFLSRLCTSESLTATGNPH